MDGTKTEMVRLINDSGILNEKIKDLDKVSFDQIIMAIHKVQDNLGITGTTAKEAGETIEGSINSAKAAWQNLLTGMANSNVDTKPLVDKFVDSVKTVAKNLLPVVKTTISGLVDVARDLLNEMMGENTFRFKGETVLRKMQESIKKVINTLDWFHKNKNLVGNAIKFMIAAFVISKVNGFTKSLSGVATGFLSLIANAKQATIATNANTAAQVAGTGATGALTVATNALNAAWKANPVGLVISGITMLISLYQILKNKSDENIEAQSKESEEIDNQTARINENKQAWDDLKESKQSQIDAGMTEINHYQNLYDELTKIVDANGKVKAGYEERASFIISELNEALGTEIKMTDGVVSKYGELKESIDQVIAKKKAQIILESQEEMYSEALNNRTNTVKELNEAEANLNREKEKSDSLNNELIEKERLLAEENNKGVWRNFRKIENYESEILAIQQKIEKQDEEVNKAQDNYNTLDNLLNEYAYNVGLYEKNMALAHAGEYDKMSTVTWNFVKDYQAAGDAEKTMLDSQISVTATNLERLRQLKEQSGSDIYDQQISDGERQLAELEKQMNQYVVVTEEEMGRVKLEWKEGLDAQLSEITGKNIQFQDDGRGNVQMYINGVASGEATSKENMANLVQKTILEISKQKTGATQAGEDLIDGINKGVANERKQSSVFSSIASFGARLLGRLRESLDEHSPSAAAEQDAFDLFAGFSIGIKKKEGTILNQIKQFGQDVLNTLNDELSSGVNTNFVNSLNGIKSGLKMSSFAIRNNSIMGTAQNNSNSTTNSKTNNFTQIINAPKQPSRIELYRQTRNLLELAKEGN